MIICAILGSRNTAGQTAKVAQALLQGASGEGAHVETIFLPQMNIERCRQCDEEGWGICRSEGRCVIEDEFSTITEKIIAADVLVFATPVYFYDLSESLKAYLDRLRRVTRHEDGKKGVEGKPAIGICLAGGGGGGAPMCALSLEKILQQTGFDVLDMVPVRRQNLEMKLETLAITGKWLATQLSHK